LILKKGTQPTSNPILLQLERRNFFEEFGLFRNPMTRDAWTYYNCGIQGCAQKMLEKLLLADRALTIKILFDNKGE